MIAQPRQEEAKPPIFGAASRKCTDCGHIRVCSVYRTFLPYLEQQFTDETRPFSVRELAQICRAFSFGSNLSQVET